MIKERMRCVAGEEMEKGNAKIEKTKNISDFIFFEWRAGNKTLSVLGAVGMWGDYYQRGREFEALDTI